MRASLPMYDLPALKAAHARYWTLIRAGLADDAPDALTPDGLGVPFWTASNVILSQTCGMPYRTQLHGKVQIVGTPDYGIAGCPPGFYMSQVIKRKEDTRASISAFEGATAAINDYGSQSGFAALVSAMQKADVMPGCVKISGAHASSVQAVADGTADIAAIDAVTWALLCEHTDAQDTVEAFDQTPPTPGLPYICSLSMDRTQVFDAVAQAISALSEADRDLLMLRGIVDLKAALYTAVPTPGRNALSRQ